uniref:Uncharacterized protein n=1 Tax=Chlamydomonas sp. HS-5 TaxID=108458 RepID=Q9XFV8_9CHLO|nr:hypothetical protein [Chlamydomonas sp. HS-5]
MNFLPGVFGGSSTQSAKPGEGASLLSDWNSYSQGGDVEAPGGGGSGGAARRRQRPRCSRMSTPQGPTPRTSSRRPSPQSEPVPRQTCPTLRLSAYRQHNSLHTSSASWQQAAFSLRCHSQSSSPLSFWRHPSLQCHSRLVVCV